MMRRATWLWIVLVAGCAVATAPNDPALNGEAGQFHRIASYLASDALGGRAPGSEGIDKARDELVAWFAEAGLAPAFDGRYTQALQVAVGVDVIEARLAFGDDRADEHRIMKPRPLAMGAGGSFAGPAVFAGYGVVAPERDYDSYAGADDEVLRGAVVVLYRYEPMTADGNSRWAEQGDWTAHAYLSRKARRAAERGAAAVVIVNPPARSAAPMPRSSAALHFDPVDVPVMMIDYQEFERMLGAGGRGDAGRAARRLQRQADASAIVEPLGVDVAGRIELRIERVVSHNVGAVVRGAGELADEVVVVGAHYDHLGRGDWGSRATRRAIHYGADDNASGTAGLVILARRFAARGGAAARSTRALMFVAFTGEERGLVGSQYFVKHLEQAGLDANDVAAMINLDMIGRLRDGRVMVFGVDTGRRWRAVIDRAAADGDLEVRATGSGFGASDHSTFYRMGVPVLHVFTGLHRDYHTPADTADKLNAAGAVRVIDLVERIVAEVAAAPRAIGYAAPGSPADVEEPTHGEEAAAAP